MPTTFPIDTPDGPFRAHVSRPSTMPAPVVVVLPEVYGVNADMGATCDGLAARGYLAVCPDLLWRLEPGVDLTDRTPAERDKAVSLYQAFDVQAGVDDVLRTLEAARALPGSNGRVALMGFCLGGLLALLATSRTRVDAAVVYYPGGANQYLDDTARIDSPLLVHLAQDDEYIPLPARQDIFDALERRPRVETFLYPACRHAFARRGGEHRDDAAAALAQQRSAAFLGAYLA